MASTTTTTTTDAKKMKSICKRLLLCQRPRMRRDPLSQHPFIPPTSTSNAVVDPTKTKTRKNRGFLPRGLGCVSSPPREPHVPESASPVVPTDSVLSSTEWSRNARVARKKKKMKKQRKRERGLTSLDGLSDVSNVWCTPSGASVDCVVAHRRGSRRSQERPSGARYGGINEEVSPLLNFPSAMAAPHFGSDMLSSWQLRYMRGGLRHTPSEFEEMMMFQTREMAGGTDVHDPYRDLRLDVDNMSYEELLELTEKIGSVSTGLGEEEILRNLRKPKRSSSGTTPSQKELKCIICQEEYEVNDDMGTLQCGHSYHTYCIKQWLLLKNACPICKAAITKS